MELITKPNVLFLDEPTTGLDASTANAVMVLLSKYVLLNSYSINPSKANMCFAGIWCIRSAHPPKKLPMLKFGVKFYKTVWLVVGQVYWTRLYFTHQKGGESTTWGPYQKAGLILHRGKEGGCLHTPGYCLGGHEMTVENYSFLIICPLSRRKCLGVPLPFQKRSKQGWKGQGGNAIHSTLPKVWIQVSYPFISTMY